ncbi:unnamed protein product [Clonostachys solani]|uniref:Uncharacterized protein n=1 Tax=Clonostachys solani TaxID=160281 RepID=A0A9N9ZM10_9HYPO|nr:unnamed protein product [Clonostachys solani]
MPMDDAAYLPKKSSIKCSAGVTGKSLDMSENAMAPNYDIQRMFLLLPSGRHGQFSSIVGYGPGSAPAVARLRLHTQVSSGEEEEKEKREEDIATQGRAIGWTGLDHGLS